MALPFFVAASYLPILPIIAAAVKIQISWGDSGLNRRKARTY